MLTKLVGISGSSTSPSPATWAPGVAPTVLPVALLLEGRPCLVVGGGQVAARKVSSLIECGAMVTLIAPELGDEVRALLGSAGAATVHRREFRRGDCDGFRFVFAATGVDAVDGLVVAEARSAGALVNAADQPARCDFYLPAVARSGPVVLAVSTSGTSPVLAGWLRSRLAPMLGPEVGRLAWVLSACRDALRAHGGSTLTAPWSSLLDEDLLDAVSDEDDRRVAARVDAWLALATAR